MVKQKRIPAFLPLLAVFVLTATALLCPAFAGANALTAHDATAELLNPGRDRYFYLDDPAALAVSESSLFVSGVSGEAYRFSLEGKTDGTVTLGRTAYKFLVFSGTAAVLSDGVLTAGEDKTLAENVLDIAKGESALYALQENKVLRFTAEAGGTIDAAFTEIDIALPRVSGIAAGGDNVYLAAAPSAHSRMSDLYMLDPVSGALKKALARVSGIEDMCVGAGGSLYALGSGLLCRYEARNGGLILSASAAAPALCRIAAGSSLVYALSDDGAVISYNDKLEKTGCVIASCSDELGFFSSPSAVSTRMSSLYVADTGNNRVVKITDSKTETVNYSFTRPTAAVLGCFGELAVAHDMDKIVFFDESGESARSLTVENEIITDLKYNSVNELYALTAGGSVYRINDAAVRLPVSDVKAITAELGKQTVYGLTSSGVIDLERGETVLETENDYYSFAVDIKGSFYFMHEGGLDKYVKVTNDAYVLNDSVRLLSKDGEPLAIDRGGVVLSTVKNASLDYGDVVICDAVRHAVYKLAADELKTEIIDSSFTPPEENGTANPATDESDENNRLIRKALSNISVYERPIEMSPHYTIEKGRNVIVAQYNLESAFAYVLIDNMQENALVAGYVYRSQLSEALPYAPPVADSAVTFNSPTRIYKYPSRNAKAVTGYEAVAKNTTFKMLSFVENFTDEYALPLRWYRVELSGGTEGYVQSIDVSVKHYDPIFERPQANAVIISVGGSTGAPLYYYDESKAKYEMEIDQPLSTGTKVEVVGTFDPSQKYTKIKYFDENYGTLEGYAETIYISYNGFDIVPVIITILAILAAVGIIIAFVWHSTAKRRKLTKA